MVRWQEVQVEILEGFGEATRAPEDENGIKGFDETRRRLEGGGCFMNGEEVGEMTQIPRGEHDPWVRKKHYTERESNPCRLLGRQA
jgi:hypothetical protein